MWKRFPTVDFPREGIKTRGFDVFFVVRLNDLFNIDSKLSCRWFETWWSCYIAVMMTSSNGNLFLATGPLCGDSPVAGDFPAQRPVTPSFDVFFDLRLNKQLSKQSWGWWFETPSRPLWRHCNVIYNFRFDYDDEGFRSMMTVINAFLQSNTLLSVANMYPYVAEVALFLNKVNTWAHFY